MVNKGYLRTLGPKVIYVTFLTKKLDKRLIRSGILYSSKGNPQKYWVSST